MSAVNCEWRPDGNLILSPEADQWGLKHIQNDLDLFFLPQYCGYHSLLLAKSGHTSPDQVEYDPTIALRVDLSCPSYRIQADWRKFFKALFEQTLLDQYVLLSVRKIFDGHHRLCFLDVSLDVSRVFPAQPDSRSYIESWALAYYQPEYVSNCIENVLNQRLGMCKIES